ncbi:hypothetical protein SAMN06265374_1513 [Roseibium denhamense]|uniref:Uncharacterized protein n=1 Tax=Roseibium denhamense TaxID=76305 RepID=A0ABY1NSP9_9HYPH|nr:hypothetical protein SAMN06265374_1513 [Roseibium denhamense]
MGEVPLMSPAELAPQVGPRDRKSGAADGVRDGRRMPGKASLRTRRQTRIPPVTGRLPPQVPPVSLQVDRPLSPFKGQTETSRSLARTGGNGAGADGRCPPVSNHKHPHQITALQRRMGLPRARRSETAKPCTRNGTGNARAMVSGRGRTKRSLQPSSHPGLRMPIPGGRIPILRKTRQGIRIIQDGEAGHTPGTVMHVRMHTDLAARRSLAGRNHSMQRSILGRITAVCLSPGPKNAASGSSTHTQE